MSINVLGEFQAYSTKHNMNKIWRMKMGNLSWNNSASQLPSAVVIAMKTATPKILCFIKPRAKQGTSPTKFEALIPVRFSLSSF